MKKLTSVSLCICIALLFGSCKKDVAPAANPDDVTPVRIIASKWVSAASITWSDTATSTGVFTYANLDVPELTQDMADNGALLIFAKTDIVKSERIFPARINGSNNSTFDLYRSIANGQSIELSHTKYVNGSYTKPALNNDVSFRYILFKNVPPANARIATGSLTGYNLEELKHMDYDAITSLLSIEK